MNQELINLVLPPPLPPALPYPCLLYQAGEPQVPRPICDTPSETETSSMGEKQVKSDVCGKDVRINGIYMHFLNLVNRSVANSQDAVGNAGRVSLALVVG